MKWVYSLMKYRTMALFLIPIVGLCSLLLFFSSFYHPSTPAKPLKTVTVETTSVTQKMLADQFDTIGSLSSTDSIDISSEISGQISAIYFMPGAYVKQGTLLIQFDDTVLKSELASARANLALSETSFRRTSELAKLKLVSEQTYDKALTNLREKENLVTVKQAQLEKLSLRAPFDGTLGSRQISVGQYMKAGQPLVHLVANGKLRVEYSLPERFLPRLKPHQQVTITSDTNKNRHYKGYVNYIDPAVNKDTRTIAVEALIDNPDHRLSAGLFVRVIHEFGHKTKRLLVPEESLIPTITGQKLFVLRNHKAKAIPVKVGAHYQAMREIASGLKLDDIIVVRGQHKLRDGSRVIAIKHK